MRGEGGLAINPELDMYNPKNGFDPKGSTYSTKSKREFLAKQSERTNS